MKHICVVVFNTADRHTERVRSGPDRETARARGRGVPLVRNRRARAGDGARCGPAPRSTRRRTRRGSPGTRRSGRSALLHRLRASIATGPRRVRGRQVRISDPVHPRFWGATVAEPPVLTRRSSPGPASRARGSRCGPHLPPPRVSIDRLSLGGSVKRRRCDTCARRWPPHSG